MGDANPGRPGIVVISGRAASSRLRAVCAGIEEEGVPHTVSVHDGALGAAELARRAAQRSALDVGVGVDGRGGVCVHHAKLPTTSAELTADPTAAEAVVRALGHNAARIVVGIPLKTAPDCDHPAG